MRQISFFILLIISLLGSACDDKLIDQAADFKCETVDKEKNTINLIGTIRYRLKNRIEKQLTRNYGTQYKDSLFIPTISSISRKILKDYSAGEIYKYKRDEIIQKLAEQTKTTFADYEIEVTNLSVWSIELPATLMETLIMEHLEHFNDKDSVDNKN